MSKMSKAILALGVVAGLGVATLPLSSYAADDKYNRSAQAEVQVEVGGAISITTDAADGVVDLGQMMINGTSETKDLNVTVSSNSEIGYDLTIMSATTETALVNAAGAKIPAGSTIAGGTSAWAYRLADTEAEGGYGAWTAITSSPVNIASHTAAAGTDPMSDVTKVNFGASASGNQQEGVYTGTVVFTATVK